MITFILILTMFLGQPVDGFATYYADYHHGNVMRNGEVYDMYDPTTVAVAVDARGDPVVPLGSKILACTEDHCIVLTVRDTGRFARINLDFSLGAWEAIGKARGNRPVAISWWVIPELEGDEGCIPIYSL